MQAQKATVGVPSGGQVAGRSRPIDGFSENPFIRPPTLAEAGIDKNLAHRARMLGALSDKEFEAAVKENRAKIADEADRITRRVTCKKCVTNVFSAVVTRYVIDVTKVCLGVCYALFAGG